MNRRTLLQTLFAAPIATQMAVSPLPSQLAVIEGQSSHLQGMILNVRAMARHMAHAISQNMVQKGIYKDTPSGLPSFNYWSIRGEKTYWTIRKLTEYNYELKRPEFIKLNDWTIKECSLFLEDIKFGLKDQFLANITDPAKRLEARDKLSYIDERLASLYRK